MINSTAINSSHDTLTSLCKGPTKHPTIQLDVSSLARGGKSNMSLAFMGYLIKSGYIPEQVGFPNGHNFNFIKKGSKNP